MKKYYSRGKIHYDNGGKPLCEQPSIHELRLSDDKDMVTCQICLIRLKKQ